MLTGRESLLRIIGRRRHFLPNRRSILSTSVSQIAFRQQTRNEKKDSFELSSEGSAKFVNCPACGAELPGHDNSIINSHLDECLARGRKRKLSQRTLLQLNFSRSKVKVHSQISEDERRQVIPADTISDCTHETSLDVNEGGNFEEYDCDQDESNFYNAVLQNLPTTHMENPSVNVVNDKFSPPSFLSEVENSKIIMEECMDDDVFSICIPTLIVGRKFSNRQEVCPQSRIRLSRNPENDKDPNAIKVLLADCENDSMLGYLPRNLAKYLSPLIDIFLLNFEVNIVSVPKDPQAAVPIKLVCGNTSVCAQRCSESMQVFKSLWRHAVLAAEPERTSLSSRAGYKNNLVLLVGEALKNNQHVFTLNEKSFLEAFISLPDDSQRLFARLYTRKGPWFRTSNLSYPEIADCDQAIKGLSDFGYLSFFPRTNEPEHNDIEEILNVLNVDELREASRMLKKKCPHGTRKREIIYLLLSSCKDGLCPELQKFVLDRTGACIRVSPLAESLVWRTERLFFLNGEQDLSTFLLVNLGIVKYPTYNCIVSEQIFSTRADLLSYEEAIEIAQIMDESLDEKKYDSIFRCIEISASRLSISLEEGQPSTSKPMAVFSSYFSASFIYSKVVLLGVSFLEHEKSWKLAAEIGKIIKIYADLGTQLHSYLAPHETMYSEAIDLLRKLCNTFISDGRRGYWTLRLSIDLEHLGRLDDSLQVAEDGVLDPWVRAGSRVALQRRALRLGKPPRRWKIPHYSNSVKRKISEVHVQGRPLNCKAGMKSVFYGEDGERCGVEQLALQYYAGDGGGWQGVHTESGIWLTIFSILIWDVIFADVPNAFRTKFQGMRDRIIADIKMKLPSMETAPLDLETDSFYEVRKTIIEELLKKIHHGLGEEILVTSWESHFGTACRGVKWEKHSLDELRAAVVCIGGPCLASICRHLAQDYRSWSSGMPDLLLWRLRDCYRGEAKLVEVKGPRDRLSEQQRAWLLVLMDCGFHVEVCQISPAPMEM